MNKAILSLGGAMTAFALCAATSVAQAQAYPSKPIRIMVGNTAGGSTDWMARLMTAELMPQFPKGFVIDNRAGASGMVASEIVAKAAPDGYTLVVTGSAHARMQALFSDVPFDPVKDFSCLGLIAGGPYVLVVHPAQPSKTIGELIAFLKKNPGTPYGTAGAGTGQHMTTEVFKSMAGVTLTDVHYKGSAALRPDLMTGRVAFAFDNISLMLPYIRQGTLRPLVITDSQRSALLPEVPTLIESGFPGFEVVGWFAVLAPRQIPRANIAVFNQALNDMLTRPSVVKNLLEQGARPMPVTPRQCDDMIAGETAKWAKIIKAAGIKL